MLVAFARISSFHSTFSWAAMFLAVIAGYSASASAEPDASDNLTRAVAVLQQAKSADETNHAELQAAWRTVSNGPMDSLDDLLQSFGDATPVGINWLSTAVDAVLERGAKAGAQPAISLLSEFALDTDRPPIGRETALNLLREIDDTLANSIVDQLINDPVARLRRPAVAALIEATKEIDDADSRLSSFQRAFDAALDEDHIVACSVALREAGHPVDHIRKFGFLMHWQIIGPFDYKDGEGFDLAYPPESLTLDNYKGNSGIHSQIEYKGQSGKVSWKSHVTSKRNGEVDLNGAIEELRDAVAYGATIFEADNDCNVQLRLRQQNPAKLWLNGELVFDQPIGHTGNFFDQYTVPVTLQKGPNLIVVKSCQTPGPVEHPFLKTWHLSVRVTDETGNAVLAANRLPTPTLDALPSASDDSASDDEETPTQEPEVGESDDTVEVEVQPTEETVE